MGTLTREKEESSVTRLGEISPLWQTFNIFRHWCTRDSLTAPIHDHFVQVSLKIVDFLDAIAKLKTTLQIYSTESRARFAENEVI